MTPNYLAWLTDHLNDTSTSAALADVAFLLSGHSDGELASRVGSEDPTPDDLNQLIDALLDKLIASCDGDVRLALFQSTFAFGGAVMGSAS